MRFAFIDAEKAQFPVTMLCRLLNVTPAGYYAWRKRPESQRSKDDRLLEIKIKAAHEAHRKVYGSPRITEELNE